MNIVLSIAYFPPVSCFLVCKEADKIIIDSHEHFEKQSYRNRCCILGPNGKQALIIPVSHENLFRTPVKSVQMDMKSRWKSVHWRSIEAAYRNSPYFEYYEHSIRTTFNYETELLFDFNLHLFKSLLEIFKINKPLECTFEFKKSYNDAEDLRNLIHPKKKFKNIKEYRQVFSHRQGFENDLSILDYLFNVGTDLQ